MIIRFESEAQATHYYNQYLTLKQAPTQTVDDYANRFLNLKRKVDPNNNTPVAYVILKFVQGLVSQLMTITYASNPADLQTAINTAKRLEGGLSLATQHQNAYSLEEKVVQLSEQLLAMQGQPETNGKLSQKPSRDLSALTIKIKDTWLKIAICQQDETTVKEMDIAERNVLALNVLNVMKRAM